jgi:hypothetical protein
MFRHLSIAIDFSTTPQSYGLDKRRETLVWRALTVIGARLKWLPRAALKRRHVLFSQKIGR